MLERLDAVIRIEELAESTLIATRLAGQKRLLVAAPDYLASGGTPGDLPALAGHRLIDKLHGADLLGWRDLLGHPAGQGEGPGAVFRCDDFEAMRGAAVEGLGIGFPPDCVAGDDLRSGRLVRLVLEGEPWNARDTGIYLALAQPSAKLRAVSTALREVIGTPPSWTI